MTSIASAMQICVHQCRSISQIEVIEHMILDGAFWLAVLCFRQSFWSVA